MTSVLKVRRFISLQKDFLKKVRQKLSNHYFLGIDIELFSLASLNKLSFNDKSSQGRVLHANNSLQRIACNTISLANSLFKKGLSFRSKDVVMNNHMMNFWSFSRQKDATFYRLTTTTLLTSSALIFCTLRAGSSFFKVLLGLGKCITAVPAAMLEWLWQNFKLAHDA